MASETALDLALVRNRLCAGKVDARDLEILSAVLRKANESEAPQRHSPYLAVVRGAIANAVRDIESGALDRAALEVNLIHNIPLADAWSDGDEEYFLKGAVTTYIEQASVDRIRALFSNFREAKPE